MCDWIPHEGAVMPVRGDMKVDIKFRDGVINHGVTAKVVLACWSWDREDPAYPPADIIAYRLATTPAPNLGGRV